MYNKIYLILLQKVIFFIILCWQFNWTEAAHVGEPDWRPIDTDEMAGTVDALKYLEPRSYSIHWNNKIIGTATCIDGRGYFLTAAHVFYEVQSTKGKNTLVSNDEKIILKNEVAGKLFNVVEVATFLPHERRPVAIGENINEREYDVSILKAREIMTDYSSRLPHVRLAMHDGFNNINEPKSEYFYAVGYPSKRKGRSDVYRFTIKRSSRHKGKYIFVDNKDEVLATFGGVSGCGLVDSYGRLVGVLRGFDILPPGTIKGYSTNDQDILRFTFLPYDLAFKLLRKAHLQPCEKALRLIEDLERKSNHLKIDCIRFRQECENHEINQIREKFREKFSKLGFDQGLSVFCELLYGNKKYHCCVYYTLSQLAAKKGCYALMNELFAKAVHVHGAELSKSAKYRNNAKGLVELAEKNEATKEEKLCNLRTASFLYDESYRGFSDQERIPIGIDEEGNKVLLSKEKSGEFKLNLLKEKGEAELRWLELVQNEKAKEAIIDKYNETFKAAADIGYGSWQVACLIYEHPRFKANHFLRLLALKTYENLFARDKKPDESKHILSWTNPSTEYLEDRVKSKSKNTQAQEIASDPNAGVIYLADQTELNAEDVAIVVPDINVVKNYDSQRIQERYNYRDFNYLADGENKITLPGGLSDTPGPAFVYDANFKR